MGRMGEMELKDKIEKVLRQWKYGVTTEGRKIENYSAIMITDMVIDLVREEIEECLK
jgi:hypothetical protein